MRRLAAILVMAACTPAGPVVREEAEVPQLIVHSPDAGGLVDVGLVPGLVVSGAADATEARRAIHDYCGNTTPFNPDADTDPLFRDPDTGEFSMPGTC
jgi:hypothetical protein